MQNNIEIKEGDIHKTKCLYIKQKNDHSSVAISITGKDWNWKPGFHQKGHPMYGDDEAWCDGLGLVIHEVVAIVDMPKPYKKRVFFKREFITPDFEVRKSRGLMCCGTQSFRTRTTDFETRYGMDILWCRDGFEVDFDEWDNWLVEYEKRFE